MKLFYGRQLLKDLNITNPADYGFDTFQLENMFSNATLSDVQNSLQTVDEYFDTEVDFVLSMSLQGEPQCGSNSDSGATGSIGRDPWYNSNSGPFYSGWSSLFDLLDTFYGDRFKGLRWNHEYRPRLFKEGSRWISYAQDNALSAYVDVQSNHLTEWRFYLNNIASTDARDAYLNQNVAQQAPYNSSDYDSVKTRFPMSGRGAYGESAG